MKRVMVVLNARAGTLLDRDTAEVRRQIHDALDPAGWKVEVVLERGRGITRAIDRAAATGGYDAVIIGGGDGSVSYGAQRFAGTDVAIGILPLGTLNLLARDIGMPGTLDEAIAALPTATPQLMDLGVVNDRYFHTLSGVGFFSQMARAREETRHLSGRMVRFLAALWRASTRTGRLTLTIDIDGASRTVDAYAVLIMNNRLDEAGRIRPKLDDGLLEVHVAEERGSLARLKAGADVIAGTWRDNPGIHSFTAHTVRIDTARRRAWASTDGELSRERTPLCYSVRRKALAVLMPAKVTHKEDEAHLMPTGSSER